MDKVLFFGIKSPGDANLNHIIVPSAPRTIQLLDLKLHHVSNWKEEEKELQLKFHFRAIILH
jgi:hypothetical protein